MQRPPVARLSAHLSSCLQIRQRMRMSKYAVSDESDIEMYDIMTSDAEVLNSKPKPKGTKKTTPSTVLYKISLIIY